MNWEAIGAIGEAIGALGVIMSLLYLAMQIRQSVASSRATAYQNFVESWSRITDRLQEPSTSDLYLRGLSSFEGLDAKERLRVAALFSSMVSRLGVALGLCRRRLMDEAELAGFFSVITDTFKAPGIREWWRAEHGHYAKEVQDWIDVKAAARQDPGS